MDLTNLAVLGEDEFGLDIQFIPTTDDNNTDPETMPESKNQVEAVYNVD